MIRRFGSDTALMLVDVQRGVDALEHWGGPTGRRNNPEAEARMLSLLGPWRGRGWPVAFTRHDSREAASPLKLSLPTGAQKEGFEPAPWRHRGREGRELGLPVDRPRGADAGAAARGRRAAPRGGGVLHQLLRGDLGAHGRQHGARRPRSCTTPARPPTGWGPTGRTTTPRSCTRSRVASHARRVLHRDHDPGRARADGRRRAPSRARAGQRSVRSLSRARATALPGAPRLLPHRPRPDMLACRQRGWAAGARPEGS